MRALYKSEAGPGLALVDVPEPQIGPEDVKIRVLRTGICGTDLHIAALGRLGGLARSPHRWFPGTSSAARSSRSAIGVHDVEVGDRVSGEGHIVCGTCRNCRAGRRHLCIRTRGVGVNRDGAFAEFVVLPETNVWVHHDRHRTGGRRDLRPVRQRRAHRAVVPAGRRGRADHRRRADRADGGRCRPARRRPLRRGHRRQRAPAGAGAGHGRRPRRRRLEARHPARPSGRSAWSRASTSRFEMSGAPDSAARR